MGADRQRLHGALAVASRLRLLDTLRASVEPLSAGELAASSGLHLSTVRFHLGILADAGLVSSRTDRRGGRGRPRVVFRAAGPGGGGTGYELLASVLAANLADDAAQRAEIAERAGHSAAVAQGNGRTPVPGLSMEESVGELVATFGELGFDPDVVPDGDGLQLRLHACPFREVAQTHPEVVCSLHLGLIRGTLETAGGAATATDLQPFVEPHLCIAHIAPAHPHPDPRG